MTLHFAGHFASGAHSLFANSVATSAATATVDVLPGDELRAKEGLRVPTALKIDVEGAEEEVITGLSRTLGDPACRRVVCEVHFGQLEARGQRDAPARIVRALNAFGFRRQRWLDPSDHPGTGWSPTCTTSST